MKASSSAYRRRQTHGHIMLSTPQDGRTDGRAGRPAEVNPFPVANLHNCPIYLSIGREGLYVGANPYVHAKDTRMGTLRNRGRVVTLFWGTGLRS